MSWTEAGILVSVWTPLVAALAIWVSPRRLSEPITYLTTVITLGATCGLLPAVLDGDEPHVHVLELLAGVGIDFRADALGLTFALLASALFLLVSIYNRGYVRDGHVDNRRRYYGCFAASIGSAVGIAFASNLLTFLLFYELLTLATYPLVAHKETREAFAGGRRYLVFALSGGLLLTTAVIWTWAATGTLDFTPGGFVDGSFEPGALAALFALFLLGCGVKAAIMPLHSWLPAAMVAPTPVSALLHAVAVVKAGVFGCIRVLGFVFGPESLARAGLAEVLLAFCGTTIVLGSVLALRQDHLKRRLAYSTIVHLSYIVLGAALVTPLGMIGAVLHLVNHGLTKITLFLCAGAIHATAHIDHVSEMRGLGRRMPWTFAALTVASLSLIGVPGLCGFVGKLFLARGAIEGEHWAYLAVLLGASLLTASYLLPILRLALFEPPDSNGDGDRHGDRHGSAERSSQDPPRARDARPAILLPLLTTALLVIAFGLVPPAVALQHGLAEMVARAVFGAD